MGKLAYAGLKSKIEKEGGNINKAPNRESNDYKEKYSPAEILFMSWGRIWCAHMSKDFTFKDWLRIRIRRICIGLMVFCRILRSFLRLISWGRMLRCIRRRWL